MITEINDKNLVKNILLRNTKKTYLLNNDYQI